MEFQPKSSVLRVVHTRGSTSPTLSLNVYLSFTAAQPTRHSIRPDVGLTIRGHRRNELCFPGFSDISTPATYSAIAARFSLWHLALEKHADKPLINRIGE